MGSVHDILKEIASTQAFERLAPFRDDQTWQGMADEERELLATLFVLQGEEQLSRGEESVLQTFALASRIAPQNASLYIRQGLALAGRSSHGHCLHLASQAFEKAIALQPLDFQSWFEWALVKVKLGVLYKDHGYLKEADHCFQKAEGLLQGHEEKGQFYWRWGICWMALSKLSGEACDLRIAIDKMRMAEELGVDESKFWTDFGILLLELSYLFQSQPLMNESLACFQKSVRKNSDCYEGWLGLATVSQQLYQVTAERSLFVQANEAFRHASQVSRGSLELWLRWGQLLLAYGKLHRDLETLKLAVDKYDKAHSYAPDHPIVLSGWAEAQMLVGSYSERLDLLREAQRKTLRCVELMSDNSRMWYLTGACLNELGRYFDDESYYLQAIEKFKYGLTFKQDDALLWYGLAQAHYALGSRREEISLVEHALSCCQRVVVCGGSGMPQFYCDWGVALMTLAEMTGEKQHVEAAIEKFEQAIAYQVKGIEEDVAGNEGLDVEWLYHYGCAYDYLGDFSDDPQHYEKAVQVLSQVVLMNPELYQARFSLAIALTHLGDVVHDVDCLQKAIELFESLSAEELEDETVWTEWGVALMTLAQLMHDSSRPGATIPLLEQADVKLHQAVALGGTVAYYQLACLCSLTGQFPIALDYLQRAAACRALPSIEEMKHDAWLEGLRHTEGYRHWMHQLSANSSHEDETLDR